MKSLWRNGFAVVFAAVVIVGAGDAIYRVCEAFGGDGWLFRDSDNLGSIIGSIIASIATIMISIWVIRKSIQPVWQQVDIQAMPILNQINETLGEEERIGRAMESICHALKKLTKEMIEERLNSGENVYREMIEHAQYNRILDWMLKIHPKESQFGRRHQLRGDAYQAFINLVNIGFLPRMWNPLAPADLPTELVIARATSQPDVALAVVKRWQSEINKEIIEVRRRISNIENGLSNQ